MRVGICSATHGTMSFCCHDNTANDTSASLGRW